MQRLKQEMGAAENTRNHMDVIEHGVPANGRSGSGSDQIPSSSCTVDPKLSIVDMSPRIIELCKDLFKKWLELDESCFTVERVSGGITNLLLKVSVKEENGDESAVTVRLYGPNTDYVINRERELQVSFSLTSRN
ncbi:Probable ethanolamine kinase [Linum perenne]